MVSQTHGRDCQTIIDVSSGVTFAGSSALFRMNKGVGRPILVDSYGRNDETVEVWYS
jgi:hypothetical protein